MNPLPTRNSSRRAKLPHRLLLASAALLAGHASAATWASSKTGNWDDISANGWNAAYPDSQGAVATYDNTNATANAQVTQNIAAGVTAGSFWMIGTTTTATAGRSWTIVPTNAITLNQDGPGVSAATITFSATSNNANDRLIFNAGTLTLADDLVVSKTTTTSIVANALQISSTIGGTGNVTLENVSAGTGNGNIYLSPPSGNSFTGSVLVRKGAVTFNHKDAFGNAANMITLGESAQGNATLITTSAVGTVANPITVAAGAGTLILGSNSNATTAKTTFAGTITLAGNLSITSASPASQPVTFSGAISGTGNLKKEGSGFASLAVANTYEGGTNIAAGTLAVGPAGTLGKDDPNNYISINGGNLLLSAATNIGASQPIYVNSGGIGVSYTPTSLPTSTATTGVFGIDYTGTGSVTDLATLFGGEWSLGSFSAGTYDGTSLGAGAGNTYRLGGGGGVLTIQNNILIGNNTLVIGGANGGTVNLPSGNTFTGSTSVTNGVVGVSSIGNTGAASGSLGAPAPADSAINLGSGANAVGINYTGTGPASTDRVLNLAGTTGTVTLSNSGTGAIAWTSPLAFTGTGARTIKLGNAGDILGGSVIGITDQGANKASVTKAGLTNSTWTLTGNTYTGNTQIDGGVLDASLASLSGSYLNLDGDSDTQYGVIQTSGTLNRTLSTTAAATNIKVGVNSGFAARGGDLTVTLSGGAPLTWGGTAFMGTGTARLVFGSTTANGKVTFTNPINLNTADAFQRVFFVEQGSGGDSAELTGVLSPGTATGGGPSLSGINKLGNGTLILSGNNTYIGATQVSAGKLLINGNQSTATGAVTVASSATLGGAGTIGGAITVNPGGKLAPGNSVGTLTALNNVAFTGTATFEVEINDAGADRLDVTGSLNIATAALVVSEISPATSSLYIIATYGSVVGAAFGSTSGVPQDYDVIIGYNGLNQIALVKSGSQTPFQQWISSPPYNLAGNDALPGADPDHDGASNLLEFALGGNPTSGSASGSQFVRMATVGGVGNVLTMTIAARATADFDPDGNRQKSTVDQITYTIEAANNLADWGGPVVTEVTGDDATAIQELLPALTDPAWTYRTFRTDGSSATDPADFMRVVVE